MAQRENPKSKVSIFQGIQTLREIKREQLPGRRNRHHLQEEHQDNGKINYGLQWQN